MPDIPVQDTETPAAPARVIATFVPVPRRADRSNGWKPHVQRAFIEALAETGSVRAACRRVGRSDHGAYQLRRHPEGDSFRAAWDAAIELGVRRIEDGAMDRALYGVEETVYYHGELRGTRRRFNERLVMFILRNRAPGRFAEGGPSRRLNAVDQAMLKRLKAQWREEWTREQWELEQEEEQEVRDSIDRFLENMRQNRLANEAIMAEPLPGDPDYDDSQDDPDHALPAIPPPARPGEPPEPEQPDQPEEPAGPRIRTIKGEWD